MPKRIGLFGGSFNPVHLGHVLVAQAAFEEAGLDEIHLIPVAQSPFKPGVQLAPSALRLRMLRCALAGRPHWHVDDLELVRGGVSYTIDTVELFRRRFPEAELFYLIGADHVSQLPAWRDASKLAQAVEFLIIPRPGQPPAPAPAPFRSRALAGFPLGVSASQIRQRVHDQFPIDLLVPYGVAEIIHNNQLYL